MNPPRTGTLGFLTPTEAAIVDLLRRSPGPVTADEIQVGALGAVVPAGGPACVQTHLSNLRRKGVDIRGIKRRGYFLDERAAELAEQLRPGRRFTTDCLRCGESRSEVIRVPSSGRELFHKRLVAAGWLRSPKRQRPGWVCPKCVAPMEQERRAEAARSLAEWRARRMVTA